MNQILRFLQIFGLGAWVGGIIFLSFIEAPGVFSILSNREQAWVKKISATLDLFRKAKGLKPPPQAAGA